MKENNLRPGHGHEVQPFVWTKLVKKTDTGRAHQLAQIPSHFACPHEHDPIPPLEEGGKEQP